MLRTEDSLNYDASRSAVPILSQVALKSTPHSSPSLPNATWCESHFPPGSPNSWLQLAPANSMHWPETAGGQKGSSQDISFLTSKVKSLKAAVLPTGLWSRWYGTDMVSSFQGHWPSGFRNVTYPLCPWSLTMVVNLPLFAHLHPCLIHLLSVSTAHITTDLH